MTNVRNFSLLESQILGPAAISSLRKLAPRMPKTLRFVVEIGGVLTTLVFLRDLIGGIHTRAAVVASVGLVALVHVVFANFAEAVAEGEARRRRRRCARCARTPSPTAQRRPRGSGAGVTAAQRAIPWWWRRAS